MTCKLEFRAESGMIGEGDLNMAIESFVHAENTIVVSDIHLADAEPPYLHHPLWKEFKRPKHFIDSSFRSFLEYVQTTIPSAIELVFNGDIFDFDSVMELPANSSFNLSWLEKIRGLNSEEEKSRFKIKVILDAHPVWVSALKNFMEAGHRVIFVIGNHDLELHWPSVQADIFNRLGLAETHRTQMRFCEWFYISNKDTLIEHGNQYDAYCLCSNPIHPLVRKGSRVMVRLPFGNLAGKYMVNGMGLMNPHATASYIKSSMWEYIRFYYRYMMRAQPFLLWTWFWSALVTLFQSLREGFLPAMKDPLTVDARIENIAEKSNASVLVVLALKEVHVHPAILIPLRFYASFGWIGLYYWVSSSVEVFSSFRFCRYFLGSRFGGLWSP